MNINIIKYFVISILFSLTACQNKNDSVIIIKKTIKPLNDSNISGTISFTQKNDSVHLEAHLFGLEPGIKAIHIHEFGDCSSDDGLSTGGHWNPTNTKHSKWGDPSGFHLGAIGNFTVDSIGHGMIDFTTDLWCINCKDNNNILGKAVIVHNGKDDYVSQPSGASGIRIGCMEISIPSSEIIQDVIETNQ